MSTQRTLVKEREDERNVYLIFNNGKYRCRLIVPRERYNYKAIKRLWDKHNGPV